MNKELEMKKSRNITICIALIEDLMWYVLLYNAFGVQDTHTNLNDQRRKNQVSSSTLRACINEKHGGHTTVTLIVM